MSPVGRGLVVLPGRRCYALGPDRYLEQLALIKRRVGIPVIGSLNGTTAEGWLEFARLIERAGADALELNFYHVATDPFEDAARSSVASSTSSRCSRNRSGSRSP
jgi:Dihydroorotate dehydrogenase